MPYLLLLNKFMAFRVSISSLQNARVKQVVKLRTRRHRDAERLTAVEGVREIRQALDRGMVPIEAFYCPQIADPAETADSLRRLEQLAAGGDTTLLEVTPDVYAKIAYRGDSGGLLLIVAYWPCRLDDLPQPTAPFFAVVENVEKPGNFGALLRTADAAGVDGVIACTRAGSAGTDIFNPNVIRASLGAVFTVPVAVATTDETISWLNRRGVQIVAATPIATTRYTAVDMRGGTAVVVGSEADGLTSPWLKAAHRQVVIPMQGSVDSLNLSVSIALLLYEVVRQRQ